MTVEPLEPGWAHRIGGTELAGNPKSEKQSRLTKDHPSQKPAGVAKEVPSILMENIEFLKALFPEVVAEDKIDFERLRSELGDSVAERPERYGVSWAGKRNAYQVLQVPSRATLVPDEQKSLDHSRTRNLVIEGENLEVLKLLYTSYFGKVKAVYIDPPYNTGNDFVYQDDYADPLDKYLRITGQKSEEGHLLTSNPETSGRFHSAWLSMMFPRLFMAKQLLRDDGSIWISIDDNELANLRLICDEIFGRENFVATFVWEKRTTRENRRVFSFNHDYILCYAKYKDQFQASRNLLPLSEEALGRYENPDGDPRGPWQSVSLNAQAGHATSAQFYDIETPGGRTLSAPPGRCWSVTKERMEDLIADKRVWFGERGTNVPRLKVFLSEVEQGLTPETFWPASEVSTNDAAKKALIDLFSGKDVYETPKPVGLLRRIIRIAMAPSDGDIMLDFFAGSFTTAHAVFEANMEDGGNRRFIMVQIQEETQPDSDARKAGLKSIPEVGEERIRRAAARLRRAHGPRLTGNTEKREIDLGFKVFRLTESNFKLWKGVSEKTPEGYKEALVDHVDPLMKGWKAEHVIFEIALKEGLGLNLESSRVEQQKTNTVLRVQSKETGQVFFVCLDEKLKWSTIRSLDLSPDVTFVCRDSALDDSAAANLALQSRLKTI